MFNTALDTLGRFYTNTFTDFNYSHRVGFLNLDNKEVADKNTVNTTSISFIAVPQAASTVLSSTMDTGGKTTPTLAHHVCL